MSNTRRITVMGGGLLALGVVAATLLWAGSSRATHHDARMQVVLYSAGNPVAKWEALGTGRMEGESFVFQVRDGVQTRQVRVMGTFAAEELP